MDELMVIRPNLHGGCYIGIASGIPRTIFSPDQIIERADAALYQAKAQGRNRSCHYPF